MRGLGCFTIQQANTLPTLIKEGNSSGIGALHFAQQESMWSGRRGWGAWDGMAVGNVPTFMDIEDVDSVYRLVSDLREKTRTAKAEGAETHMRIASSSARQVPNEKVQKVRCFSSSCFFALNQRPVGIRSPHPQYP